MYMYIYIYIYIHVSLSFPTHLQDRLSSSSLVYPANVSGKCVCVRESVCVC